jgi:hypothetical protein
MERLKMLLALWHQHINVIISTQLCIDFKDSPKLLDRRIVMFFFFMALVVSRQTALRCAKEDAEHIERTSGVWKIKALESLVRNQYWWSVLVFLSKAKRSFTAGETLRLFPVD